MVQTTSNPILNRAKIYGLIVLWITYLIVLPYIFSWQKIIGILFIVFPGIYLFSLFGLLIHESWHKYLPNVPNKILFPLFCFMLISDPQVYDLTHRSHHTDVNSYQDMQFHPLGEINKRYLRIIYNFVEIFLGVIFVMSVAGIRLPKEARYKKQYSYQKFFLFLICRVSFITTMGYCSHLVFKVNFTEIFIPYLFTYWGGSLVIHHNMLIEHGNLIVEGNLTKRNLRTRNLKPTGLITRIIFFFTHNDPLEHTFHHTSPQINNRPFPERYSMPDNTTYITFFEHLGILKDMLIGVKPSDRSLGVVK